MSTANQNTLAESGALDRPSMLEKRSYVPWASRFMRFLENKQEEGELMKNSIDNGPYIRKEIDNPNDTTKKILEPINACSDAKQMWNRIKRLMQGSDISQQERHSRLMDEFDKFIVVVGESLTFVYEREQILLALKDEARAHLNDEYNDFMLDNAYGDNTLGEINAAVIMIVRIKPIDDKSDAKPTYDYEFISEVNASKVDMINGLLSKSDHEPRHHEKLETIIQTSVDDQIDFDIIFDDPYVDNNIGQAGYVEAEKQRKKNFELQRQKALLQRELETCKERVQEFENKPQQPLEIPVEQTYFSSPSTSNVSSVSSSEKSYLPSKKMPNESKLLKLFVNLDNELNQLGILINNIIQREKERTTYAYGDVRAKNQDLLMTIFELKAKLKLAEKGVASSSSVRRPESKDTNSKKRVLLNTKSKSTSKDVNKS
ncbi:hypothetical protein Tco_0880167 [Tanacetum coccineum]